MSFSLSLKAAKEAKEDFEWYPTTNEILQVIADRINATLKESWCAETRATKRFRAARNGEEVDPALLRDTLHIRLNNLRRTDRISVLDVGAGNGKALEFFQDNLEDDSLFSYFAIEKSSTLIRLLPKDILLLGVDFWNTGLYDKTCNLIFSNPPYKAFNEWMLKLIKEAPAEALIYLVVPERWRQDTRISDILTDRNAVTEVIHQTDFLEAEDRKARAKVEVLEIWFDKKLDDNDPFVRFFDENFDYPDPPEEEEVVFEDELRELAPRMNFIEALCALYSKRLVSLQNSIHSVCRLPHDVLKEFEIPRNSLITSIRTKTANARKEYWQRLFDGMKEITSKLTHKSRESMVSLLNAKTGIDFNRENAYAILFWSIENANSYFDNQLIETYELLVDKANVENYVSNQRVFKWNRFEYHGNSTHFRLKVGHRIILTWGGLNTSQFDWDNGLSERGQHLVRDLLTVAENLGFQVRESEHLKDPSRWDSNGSREFYHTRNGTRVILMSVRAFRNGNMHFQFDPSFIHALNTQHGKLKGWLRDDTHAAQELDIDMMESAKWFSKSMHIKPSPALLK